ncbi:hypothetical protein LT335_00678 [Spiroplasma sp. JKS002669]|nr:hypothetical protein [Spiroplasma sp. JKS002669]MCL8209569.1 hypothetical protein [Spiroplasma sp. JKS002670]MCL8210380.1 hypothetical protein [Spiroplasma sp. JKS002671]
MKDNKEQFIRTHVNGINNNKLKNDKNNDNNKKKR